MRSFRCSNGHSERVFRAALAQRGAMWQRTVMDCDAQAIIDTLDLAPHPEGGWYRETWRAAGIAGERSPGTAIYFLLEAGTRSHWHRVDADELWLWHAGDPLHVLVARQEGPIETVGLGPAISHGDAPQCRVPAGCWQSTEARIGWALVSCVVVPGFDFAGFELAPAGWSPAG